MQKREYAISHEYLPTFNEHEKFVRGHPYREWFIVKEDEKPIGAFYISKDNSIGLNLNTGSVAVYREIINWILDRWEPLEPIKSVRPKFFFIRIPIGNDVLTEAVEELESLLIENTYSISNDNYA